jgi:hypothetical protein
MKSSKPRHEYIAITYDKNNRQMGVVKVRGLTRKQVANVFRKSGILYYTSMLSTELKAWDLDLWERIRKEKALLLRENDTLEAAKQRVLDKALARQKAKEKRKKKLKAQAAATSRLMSGQLSLLPASSARSKTRRGLLR